MDVGAPRSGGEVLVRRWAEKLDNLGFSQTIKLSAGYKIIHHAQTRRTHEVVLNILLVLPDFGVEVLAIHKIFDNTTVKYLSEQ